MDKSIIFPDKGLQGTFQNKIFSLIELRHL